MASYYVYRNRSRLLLVRTLLQVLSIVGVLMVVFQLFIYPIILKRAGVVHTQRWASLVVLPLYPSIPMLSNLIGHERTLVVATTSMYFLLNSSAAAVSLRSFLASERDTRAREEVCFHLDPPQCLSTSCS